MWATRPLRTSKRPGRRCTRNVGGPGTALRRSVATGTILVMRRLLQLGTLLLLLATVVAPLSECFDRWDAPGISNDVEFAVFVSILGLCLVLLVGKLIATLALVVQLVLLPDLAPGEAPPASQTNSLLSFFVLPLSPPPLRI